MQPGNGELTDAEVPIGMAGPFDVEFIHDGTVVDALDRHIATAVAIVETASLALELRDVNRSDAETIFVDVEVGQRLLCFRLDLQQNDVLRRVVADDYAAQERPIACIVMIAEEALEGSRQVEGGRIALGEHRLEAK